MEIGLGTKSMLRFRIIGGPLLVSFFTFMISSFLGNTASGWFSMDPARVPALFRRRMLRPYGQNLFDYSTFVLWRKGTA
jgi:hypothetical protein